MFKLSSPPNYHFCIHNLRLIPSIVIVMTVIVLFVAAEHKCQFHFFLAKMTVCVTHDVVLRSKWAGILGDQTLICPVLLWTYCVKYSFPLPTIESQRNPHVNASTSFILYINGFRVKGGFCSSTFPPPLSCTHTIILLGWPAKWYGSKKYGIPNLLFVCW